jgi:curved DNA-binding protein CbpA
MLQSQGLRPLDPYRTLQLHPHAPRELIVEAYWALVARQKRRLAMGPAAGKLIGELNAAYGLLMSPEQRRAFDEEHGLTGLHEPLIRVTKKGFGLIGRRTTLTVVSDHADFYHLLRIDREADAEIIDVAYAVLSRYAGGSGPEAVLLQKLIEDAYHTLRNPQLRAQYDEMLAAGTEPVAGNAPYAPPDGTIGAATAGPAHVTAGRPAPTFVEDVGVGTQPPVITSLAAPPDAGSSEPAAEPATPRPTEESGKQPEPVVPERAAASRHAPSVAAREYHRAPRGLLQRIGLGARATAHAEHSPALRSALAPPRQRYDDLGGAADARLLTLRGEPLEALEAPPHLERPIPRHLAARAGDAALTFIAGPLAGDRFALGRDTIMIGTSYQSDIVLPLERAIAPEHARIWRHGEHFVFRQLDGGMTMIGGEQLTLPLVMLDDGDEIQIGAHKMQFSRGAE